MNKQQEAWRALPARLRVELALAKMKSMGVLLDYIRNIHKFNMSGSAYRCHPQCHFRDGILFVDHWKTWGDYGIWIANNPGETPVRGCQDSLSTAGDPYPTIASGWTIVWSGSWKKQGPWCEKIKDVLVDMTEQADVLYEQQAAAQQAAREAADKQKQEQDRQLLSAWS